MKKVVMMVVLLIAGFIIGFIVHDSISGRSGNQEEPGQKIFSIIPSDYSSFKLSRAEVGSKPIEISDDQKKELIDILSGYKAETTSETAFVDTYWNNAYFVFTFLNSNGAAYYSAGIMIGRNGTEECYAVSNLSDLNYAKVVNSGELYKKVIGRLSSWGYNIE